MLVISAALLVGPARADDSAKAGSSAKGEPGVALASREVAARAAAEAASFGLVSVIKDSVKRAQPSPWSARDEPGRAAAPPVNIYAESIEDAAGTLGLSLSSAGSGSERRVGPTRPAGVRTLGHGEGVADLDGFDHRTSRVADTHVASAAAARPGGRTPPDVIQRIVRENFGHLDLCYESALRRHPGLAGRVAVKFIIDRRGAVALATDAGSDLPDADVVACVVRAFDAMVFPVSNDSAVTVIYPVAFAPAGDAT